MARRRLCLPRSRLCLISAMVFKCIKFRMEEYSCQMVPDLDWYMCLVLWSIRELMLPFAEILRGVAVVQLCCLISRCAWRIWDLLVFRKPFQRCNDCKVYLVGLSAGIALEAQLLLKFCWTNGVKVRIREIKRLLFFEPELVGVVLHASYNNMGYTRKPLPEDIPVLQVLAENDELMSKENMEKFKSGLPLSKTVIVHIEGGNHAGFGQYGPLPHKLQGKVDGLCTIGLEKQQTQAADATIKFLQERVANKAGYQMVTKAESGYLPS